MKRNCWTAVLLFSSLAVAQAAPLQAQTKSNAPGAPATKQQPNTAPAAVPGSKPVAENTPVITIPGICENSAAKPADCKLVVTRAQFEKLVTSLTGGRQTPEQVPPQVRRQFAVQYARLLTFATEAEKQGLDKDPATQELLRFARMQALAQEFTHVLQAKAKPTPQEVQKYYQDNQSKFQKLTLERIVVPNKPGAKAKPGATNDLKKVAEDLRQRAASGADFKTLQSEAYSKAGMQNPPETKLVVQPQAVPPSQHAVLQLKPGEVSQVIDDFNGFYIYKLDSQQQVPFSQVQTQIETALGQQKVQQEMEHMLKPATPNLNEDYFGAEPPAQGGIGIQPQPGAPPRP